jgi:nitrate/TMAO reductase-like tetraheme cytochrome c subunit
MSRTSRVGAPTYLRTGLQSTSLTLVYCLSVSGDVGGGKVVDREPDEPQVDEEQLKEPEVAPAPEPSPGKEAAPAAAAEATPEAAAGAQAEKTPKKPRKRRRLRLALIIAGAVIIVLAGASFATAEYTSRSKFCDSCHEMDPYYKSWQASAHASAECRNCHIPPGFVPYAETKLFAFREIYVHIAKQVEAPLAVTREIRNANCLACHAVPGELTLATKSNVTFSHQAHEGQNCVTCHVRVVHRTVNPPYYVAPAAMSSCLECHNGTIAPGTCSTCHTQPHEVRGECSNCHNQQSWSAEAIDHPFPRTGGHAGLNCTDCHVSKPGAATIAGTDLARPDPNCVSCHGDHHNGLTDCASCHTPEGWSPSSFNHPQVGEHIPSGEKPLDCASCHTSGYGTHSCTPCHDGTPTGG